MSKRSLIIFFSLVLMSMTSCSTFHRNTVASAFPMPPKPRLYHVEFMPQQGGYFLSSSNANLLIRNVDELKAYGEKLEVVIKAMNEYYNH